MAIYIGRNKIGAAIKVGKEDLDLEIKTQEKLLDELDTSVKDLQEAPRTDGEYFVKVVDYDGTILKEARLNNGETFEMPTSPSHDGLVFEGWSCSQDIVDNMITIQDNDVMAGPMYTTASGLSEFDIVLTSVTGLAVTLNMAGNKDWGDGTSDAETTHTYSDYGKYTITCDGTSMGYNMLFGQTSSKPNRYCVAIRLANVDQVNGNFNYCHSLRTITIPTSATGYFGVSYCFALLCLIIPNTITNYTSNAIYMLYSLKYVVLPKSSRTYYGNSFSGYNYALKNIVIPTSITSSSQNLLSNNYALEEIKIPPNVKGNINGVLSSCYNLKSVKVGNGINKIDSYSFAKCYALTKYDFSTHTSVPTLSSTDAFANINTEAKIIVPDELYDSWVTATNWATYANYIYKASEVQDDE